MKTNKAFTLIELLVVVLIIGILAAIAVPQYQKAVMKGRLHQGLSLVESIYQAQQAYYLANGKYAEFAEDLDISVPDGICTDYHKQFVNEACNLGTLFPSADGNSVQFITPDRNMLYTHFLKDWDLTSSNLPLFEKGKRYCYAKPNNETAKAVCQSMGGSLAGESRSWAYYALD